MKQEKDNKDKLPLVIHCYSPKGGTGKTTLSTQIACIFRKINYKVAFYDLDKQKSATHYLANLHNKALRPNLILSKFSDSPEDAQVIIYDYSPNTDFIPPKGSIVVAPTGSSSIELHAYRKIIELEKTHTVIKVLNKFSLVMKSDREALEAIKSCCVISQNAAFEYAMDRWKTIVNVDHPGVERALAQLYFLIDCIIARKTIEMDRERMIQQMVLKKRLKDYTQNQDETIKEGDKQNG